MSDAAHILPPREGAPGGPGEEAARWLAYLYSGEATDEGHRDFAEWLQQSPANARAYRAMQQTWQDMAVPGAEGFFRERASPEHAAERVIAFEQRRRRRPAVIARRRTIAAAAAIAATVVVSVGVWRTQIYDPVTTASYATRTGEIRTVGLPDGSKVTLAAASSVQTEFSKKRRHVNLVQGGAYFDVASNPAKPFTVAAASTRIRVVGTQFDVNRAPQHVRVAVVEGVVQVAPAAAEAEATTSGVRLKAGQRVTASLEGRLGPIEDFDPSQAAPWRQGRLVYRNARLQDVVAEVNRYRTDKITLADAALMDLPITMAVRTDQTDALLEGLAETGPVVVQRSDGGVVIRRKP
ncbi:MAG: FecR domain-containing protein [Phenylobacterium sp.]|uniref:FecR family protein n=1 Tax=Phenylobacterium sp. TaxID=1871053 RepID=UPI0027336B2E|nr:FecR domain-containing protein [Phenylobacterium sp.]MDP3746681.1 FecR domain-containing protein [Phenylobacterium sp.]